MAGKCSASLSFNSAGPTVGSHCLTAAPVEVEPVAYYWTIKIFGLNRYLVKALDSGESTRLQYRSLKKVPELQLQTQARLQPLAFLGGRQ